jgi:hypothetical protein
VGVKHASEDTLGLDFNGDWMEESDADDSETDEASVNETEANADSKSECLIGETRSTSRAGNEIHVISELEDDEDIIKLLKI